MRLSNSQRFFCRSREGAWIEIPIILAMCLIAYGRSREGAWIEITSFHFVCSLNTVAPARERGLKLEMAHHTGNTIQSLPRGSVD